MVCVAVAVAWPSVIMGMVLAPVINEALHVMLAGIWWRRAALLSVLDTGMLDH